MQSMNLIDSMYVKGWIPLGSVTQIDSEVFHVTWPSDFRVLSLWKLGVKPIIFGWLPIKDRCEAVSFLFNLPLLFIVVIAAITLCSCCSLCLCHYCLQYHYWIWKHSQWGWLLYVILLSGLMIRKTVSAKICKNCSQFLLFFFKWFTKREQITKKIKQQVKHLQLYFHHFFAHLLTIFIRTFAVTLVIFSLPLIISAHFITLPFF